MSRMRHDIRLRQDRVRRRPTLFLPVIGAQRATFRSSCPCCRHLIQIGDDIVLRTGDGRFGHKVCPKTPEGGCVMILRFLHWLTDQQHHERHPKL